MDKLILAIIVLIFGFFLIAMLIPVVISLVFALALGVPAGGIGAFASWALCQRRAQSDAERIVKNSPVGAIVQFAYDKSNPAVIWEVDEAELSDRVEHGVECSRWTIASLAAFVCWLITVFVVSLGGTTWGGLLNSLYRGVGFGPLGLTEINISPFNIANWGFLEWIATMLSFGAFASILWVCLEDQKTHYTSTVNGAAQKLIQQQTPILRELSDLYGEAWEATKSAAQHIGRTGSVTLLASIENNWDALKSENLLSLLQTNDWNKFRLVCEGIRTDARRLNDYAQKYLRGEEIPTDVQPPVNGMTPDIALQVLGLCETWLLIDTSGSMGVEGIRQACVGAVAFAERATSQGYKVALIGFSSAAVNRL
jgi:hypothetical protein